MWMKILKLQSRDSLNYSDERNEKRLEKENTKRSSVRKKKRKKSFKKSSTRRKKEKHQCKQRNHKEKSKEVVFLPEKKEEDKQSKTSQLLGSNKRGVVHRQNARFGTERHRVQFPAPRRDPI